VQSATATNAPPLIVSITGALVPIGLAASISVSFTDTDGGDTLKMNWGDGSVVLTQSVAPPTAVATHAYAATGVYLVRATITDNSDSAFIESYAVVYDPSAGHVTGSGTIKSPAGTFVSMFVYIET
jgi:PKD repeat protein